MKSDTTPKIEILKTASVAPAAWNPRTAITDDSVRPLAASISADGQLQAINVIKSGKGYVCFDGCRRLAAAKLLGMASVKAVVWDISEDEAKVKTVTANLQREDDDPLLAARVIADLGGDAEVVASKLGKTAAWVRRRAKLNALSPEMRETVGAVTLEVLERVSDYTAEQQAKIAKQIALRAKWANGAPLKWSDVKRDVEALSMDLDAVWFDKRECRGCTNRTGAEWFAEADSGLGRCLDCKCYKAKIAAYRTALVDKVIPADAERVEVEYEWQVPVEARNDSKMKRDRKHPCAYYWFDGGTIEVRWAKSKAQIDRDRAEADAKRDAEREAERAERNADDEVEDRMLTYVGSDDGEAELRLAARNALKDADGPFAQLVVDAFAHHVQSCYGCEFAAVIRAMPMLAEFAGIADTTRDAYLGRHPEGEDEEE